VDRPDLSGKTLPELFSVFCQMAQIEFSGTLEPQREDET
jgi:hypothetical protein